MNVTEFAGLAGLSKCAQEGCATPVALNSADGSNGILCPEHMPVEDKARKMAVSVVSHRAFEGRKGHGGSVGITKRVLDREQLTRLINESISRYQDYLKHYGKGAS